MTIVLWILQVALALHTVAGAVWKFSNSPEQTMPSIGAIPQGAWMGMSAMELLCSVCLVVPAFYAPVAIVAPLAAAFIAGEMLLYSGLHLYSGDKSRGPLVYWGVVAVLCTFIAYGRLVLVPV